MEDVKINVKIKLAALWVAVVLCAAYADILGHMRSDLIQEMIAGKAGGVPINQETLLASAIGMTILIVMVFLSLTLKAKANRWANIVVGILYTGVTLFTILPLPIWGQVFWVYYYVFAIAEVVFCALIVWYAWKWPKQEGQP